MLTIMVLAHNINEGQRTQDVRISQDITFDSMLLTTRTLQGLKDSGFHRPSPIQLHGIPLGKCGFDLLLEAKSGTGKTAVFTVIALEKIDLNKGLQVVILAPTREIAMQIHDVIKQIGVKYRGLCVEVVMGGLPFLDDVEKLKKNVHIIVGSPGRLKHLIHNKHIVTTSVRLLILDEADKLMEKSFVGDINYIHSFLPHQKQVIMSSATFPESSRNFIKSYVQNAQHICPNTTNVLLGIEQTVTLVQYSSNIVKQTQYKFTELLKILSNRQFKQCLIFCNYQARVNELYKMLNKEKWPAGQLYGHQQQRERLDALKILQEYKCRLLIATDLAARGIDASNVDLVVNFESPCNWETYLHRIGRAGRFGSYGLAVTILSQGVEHNNFKALIESLKLPFLLKDFWLSTPFCINNNVISDNCYSPDAEDLDFDRNNISKTNERKNYTKLWDALTGDGKNTEVESFGNLCESFTEPCSKIDLFNDLIQSFEQDDNTNNENINFSQLNLIELSHKGHRIRRLRSETADSLNYKNTPNGNLQTVAVYNNVVLNNGENHDQITHNILNSTHIDKNQSDNVENDGSRSSTESSKTNSAVMNHSGHDLKIPNGKNCNAEAFDSNYEIEDENVCQALINFNLPTSFSSSKQTQFQNKCFAHFHNANEKDRRRKKTKCSSTVKVCEQLNQENRKKESIPKVLRHSDDNEEEECYVTQLGLTKSKPRYSHHMGKIFDKDMHVPSTSNYIKKSKPTNTYPSQNVYETKGPKEYYNRKYFKWYNSLKLQVKQIELSIYLNEISKL